MNFKKSWVLLSAATLAVSLVTGCQSLVSQRVDTDTLPTTPATPTPGNSFYYLPKVELMLTAVLTNVPSTNVLAPTVSMSFTNISLLIVSNNFAPVQKATTSPLTLTVTTNSLFLGTSETNCVNLSVNPTQVVLTSQPNGVVLTESDDSSSVLTLPQGSNVLGKITISSTTNTLTLKDDLSGSITLVTGTNYVHFLPQSGGAIYLSLNSGPSAWKDSTSSFLNLYLGTHSPTAPAPTPTITKFSERISVRTTNWTTVSATNWFYLVTVTNFFTPERRGLFSLNIATDYLGEYSETYGIQLDSNGFIQSVNASNSDQTIQIITELVQTATAIAGLPPLPTAAAVPSASYWSTLTNASRPSVLSVVFDPTSAESVENANARIIQMFGMPADTEYANVPIRIGVEFSDGNPLSSPKMDNGDYLTQYKDPFCGVAYRPLKPYIVDVQNDEAPLGPSLQQYLVMSPNQSPVLTVPVERAPFVTRTTGLTFTSGIFAGANYNRPSQAAAVIGLPATLINQYLSSLTNLVQLKLNIATGEAQTQQQNLSLLNATTNLLQAEQVLKQLQAAAATNSTPSTSPH